MTPRLFDPPTETKMGAHALVLDIEQGSPEWLTARCGIPTASRFDEIVTSAGKPTSGEKRHSYVCELVGELIGGTTTEHFQTAAMEHGRNMEPKARGWYQMTTSRTVEQVGFVMHDSRQWGASPDGLVGDDSGIEIKSPWRKGFIKALLDKRALPLAYTVQVQAEMWVCERQTWDFVLYSEDHNLLPVIVPVGADAKLHAAFDELIPAFVEELTAAHDRALERMQ